jgi:methylenetetrahydrofolate dehydrogenase (NADP+)/methenyltetrahydrofolate cyclohydrolase
MPATLIDGKAVAAAVRAEAKSRAAALVARGVRPGLAAILAGADPASRVYVRNKVRACEETGLHSEVHEFPAPVAESALLECVARLNADPRIHGILVQLPLPGGVDANRVLAAVSPAKDVDGFHAESLGALVRGERGFVPGTPAGVMRLLEHAGVPLAGRQAVVLGRSTIVGKPMALLLLQKDATVTICHSKWPRSAGRNSSPRRWSNPVPASSTWASTGAPTASWSATWISSRCGRWRAGSRPCPAASVQ